MNILTLSSRSTALLKEDPRILPPRRIDAAGLSSHIWVWHIASMLLFLVKRHWVLNCVAVGARFSLHVGYRVAVTLLAEC